MTSTRPSRPSGAGARRRATRPSPRRPVAVVAVVVAVVALALVAALAAGSGDDADTSSPAAGGDRPEAAAGIRVRGAALPPLPDDGRDPAVGRPLPAMSGTTLDGDRLTVPTRGRPAIVLFVAHWCPHCQAEVPLVQRWVDGGGLPAGVDLATVSTAVDPRRPNYPPGAWLAEEGWTAPVLTDDGDQAGARAAGVTAFPYFVAVDAAGDVIGRASGELTTAQLDDLAATLAREAS